MSKFRILTIIASVFIFALTLVAGLPKGVNLAKLQGWDIVIGEQASPSEKYAAKEFQQFFQQASGVMLSINEKVGGADKHIFIGSSEMLMSSKVRIDTKDFGDEDFRIIVRDDNIAIAGGRPRGTLYGVYTFLED